MNEWSKESITCAGVMRRLDQVDRLDAYSGGFIRSSFRLNPIGEAQEILVNAGCIMVGWDMVEGDFYQLRYIPGASFADIEQWPDEIKLRFISNASLNRPRLVLTYQKDDVQQYFGSSGALIYDSAAAEARMLLAKFVENHPGVESRWYPIFSEAIPAI